MNERKPVRAAVAGEKAAPPDAMQHQPPRSEATMHTDAEVRKAGGRLSREDQRRLGDILQRVYDEVLRQGVPDRFKNLLDQFDRDVSAAETMRGQGGGEDDHLVGAKAFDNKGSRS
jgi:Anti-sigma factor NepR